jgi:hypothetical protein
VPWAGAGCGADCAQEFTEKIAIALANIEYFAAKNIRLIDSVLIAVTGWGWSQRRKAKRVGQKGMGVIRW